MKKALVAGYIGIALMAGTYSYFLGETRHRNFAYNLGRGLAWPVVMFSDTPEVDGDSPDTFNVSYMEVLRSGAENGLGQGVEISTKLAQFYAYAKHNEAVTQADYEALLGDHARGTDVMLAAIAAIQANPDVQEEYMDYLDGMSAADLFDEQEDLQEEITDLLEDRPAAPAAG